MSTRLLSSIAWCPLVAFSMCGAAAAQCEDDWKPTDGFPGIQTFANANALTIWDPDGNGPLAARLVAGGDFQYIADRVADNVAAFVPETGLWEDLGGGVDMLIDTEEGGQVIDAASVSVLGTFQDDLIAAGPFDDAGGVPVNHIARWDGASWSALGSGLQGFANAMTNYNGELVVAGLFGSAGGVTVNNIARWNGASWQPLGSPAGINGPVFGVTVYNGELIAAGEFSTAGGVPANRIARWNGSQWQALGTGLNDGGHGLVVFAGHLYVGGDFTLAGGVPQTKGIARWDGASWHPVAGGAFFGISDLIVYQGDLIAGGVFTALGAVGGPSKQIARLDTATQTWHSMEGGFNTGAGTSALAVYNGELIAAGGFSKAGKRTVRGLARWIGETGTWESIAPGFNITPSHFITYRGELVAGGSFQSAGDGNANGVARWDGQAWHPLGTGIHLDDPDAWYLPNVFSLGVFGDDLIVGGNFAHAGDVDVNHIAAWNGETQTWSDVGGGVSGVEVPRVNALVVYDGELIAAGHFETAGGVAAHNVASWNGKDWQPLADGLPTIVLSMIVHDGDLFVSTQSVGLQRWDGSAWHAMPGGPSSAAMTVYAGQLIAGAWDPFAWDGTTWTMLPGWSWDPDGAAVGNFEYVVFGDDLIIGGQFENAAGLPDADGLVRFDGTTWHSMNTPNGVTASITSAGWVHEGELFTNGRVAHPDGSLSNWRRFGSAWSDIGSGLAGVNGIPALAGTGALVAGCAGSLSLTSAKPSAPALLFAALSSSPVPFKGGVLAAFPFFLTVPLATNGTGALLLPFTWPSGVPSGISLVLQYAVKDAAAVQGVSLSNAVQGVTP